jgi:import inner membrane translocase subunit TIM22
MNPPSDPSQAQLAIFRKREAPQAFQPPSKPTSADISHHQEGYQTIYEIILSNPPLTSDQYSPDVAMHPPVPINNDSPYSLETITRRALPYPLPWQPSASPRELPPDVAWISNSCALRATVGTAGGAGMGLLMGIFMGAMSDTTPPVTMIAGKDVPQAPFREQMRVVLRATGEKSLYWCKSFAFLTGIFGGSECLVEKYRGKSDVWNSVYSGCITGAALQAKSGPQAAAFGCGGFAMFSLIADKIMGNH